MISAQRNSYAYHEYRRNRTGNAGYAAGEKKRLEMGETGYRRVMQKYRVEYMQKTYWEIYRDFAEQMGQKWQEEPVKLPEKQK